MALNELATECQSVAAPARLLGEPPTALLCLWVGIGSRHRTQRRGMETITPCDMLHPLLGLPFGLGSEAIQARITSLLLTFRRVASSARAWSSSRLNRVCRSRFSEPPWTHHNACWLTCSLPSNEALTAAQAAMRPVATDMENSQTKSRYASYAALDRVLRPIYTNAGFSLTFNTAPGAPEAHVRVTCTVCRASGRARAHLHPRKINCS